MARTGLLIIRSVLSEEDIQDSEKRHNIWLINSYLYIKHIFFSSDVLKLMNTSTAYPRQEQGLMIALLHRWPLSPTPIMYPNIGVHGGHLADLKPRNGLTIDLWD